MSDPNLEPPDLNTGVGGGQPPLLGGPSLADEEKALKKGSTLPLVLGVIAAILVVAVLGAVLLQGGDENQYGAIGQQLNGMKQEHFDGFWACALPNQPLDRLDTNRALSDAITERARRSPARYGSHVRDECLVKLSDHRSSLRELIAPEDLHAQLDELEGSLDELNEGWDGYLRQLDQFSEGYDEDAARPHISKIAKGWYDYRTAHGALNDTIRENLHGDE